MLARIWNGNLFQNNRVSHVFRRGINGYFLAAYNRGGPQRFLVLDPVGALIMDRVSDSISIQALTLDPYRNVYYCGSVLRDFMSESLVI